MNLNIDQEKDIQKAFKAQRLALYWLLGLIYSGFLGLQLGRNQAITDFNYNLHEMLYIPFNLAQFLVPVVFLIYLFLVIKYLRRRGRQKGNLMSIALGIVVIASLIVIFSITNHQFHEVSTGGIFEVEDKLHEENKYYILVDDKKIKVSQNEFHLVNENQSYLLSFVWNTRTPTNGRLEIIEPIK